MRVQIFEYTFLSGGMDQTGNTTIFIGGVSAYSTEEEIAKYFTPFGDISLVKLVPLKACAFITFVSHYSAEQAIEHMNGFLLGATKLKVSWGRGETVKQRATIPVHQIIPPSMRLKKQSPVVKPVVSHVLKVRDPLVDSTKEQNLEYIEYLNSINDTVKIFFQNGF